MVGGLYMKKKKMMKLLSRSKWVGILYSIIDFNFLVKKGIDFCYLDEGRSCKWGISKSNKNN